MRKKTRPTMSFLRMKWSGKNRESREFDRLSPITQYESAGTLSLAKLGALDRVLGEVGLLQHLAVDVDVAVGAALDRLARQPDDALDEILHRRIDVRAAR